MLTLMAAMLAAAQPDPTAPPEAMMQEPALPAVEVEDRPAPLTAIIELEGRWFPEGSDDDVDDRVFASAAIEPSLRVDTADGQHSLRVTAFGRIDTADDKRTHADIREAKWVGSFGAVEAVAGIDRMFWGVTEAAHLTNIVNQIDALEDIDREDFLGQPLASLALRTQFGTLSGYVMPWFRPRHFPGRDDRPNLPLPIARKPALYESSKGNDHVDWALRWQLNDDGLDVGLSFFSGTDRDPMLVPGLNSSGAMVLRPYYALIDQLGLDAQWSLGSLALKFEGIKRWTDLGDYGAVAAGFEYTIGGIGAGGGDLGILSEYLWNDGDGRGPSPFEDDLMVGLRWSGNDDATTQLLAGLVFDLGGHGTAVNIEGSRRIAEALTLSIDARLFSNGVDDQLTYLRDDSFVQLKLRYYF